jgi:hypothetical protein
MLCCPQVEDEQLSGKEQTQQLKIFFAKTVHVSC